MIKQWLRSVGYWALLFAWGLLGLYLCMMAVVAVLVGVRGLWDTGVLGAIAWDAFKASVRVYVALVGGSALLMGVSLRGSRNGHSVASSRPAGSGVVQES